MSALDQFEFDRRMAASDQTQFFGGGAADVDHAATGEGAAVI